MDLHVITVNVGTIQSISQNMYNILCSNNISWCCINCGVPNFSTGIFLKILNVNTSNSFSYLPNMTRPTDESTL